MRAKNGKRTEGVKYPTEALLESEALSSYQRDFARALLSKPEYGIEEARETLDAFLGKEG